MKIALIQTDIAWNDPATNVQSCARLATEAIAQGAELLIYPEMFTSGFSLPVGEIAESSADAGRELLRATARQHTVYTIGSLPEVGAQGELFNTAYLYRPDGTHESYRKLHLFSYGEETSRYTAGERTLTIKIGDLRCTLFICYDLRFPLPFHQRAEETDLFIVVANWPATRREHWITLLKARAIENQAYVAGVNRVGEGGGLHYSGDSILFAPDGSALTEISSTQTILTANVDAGRVAAWRENFPAVRDRRKALYQSM
jgi:predicted amidohydrolase